MITPESIIQQAELEYKLEVERETNRRMINEHKRKLRARGNRTFWQRVFPWKITITRRES